MKRRVAVEGGLTDVAQELQTNGYDVVDFNNQNMNSVDAVVITGENQNMMGMATTSTKAPVIEARGMNAMEIRTELEKRLR